MRKENIGEDKEDGEKRRKVEKKSGKNAKKEKGTRDINSEVKGGKVRQVKRCTIRRKK